MIDATEDKDRDNGRIRLWPENKEWLFSIRGAQTLNDKANQELTQIRTGKLVEPCSKQHVDTSARLSVSQRKKMLAAEVARNFDVHAAALVVGATFADLSRWMKDDAFRLEIDNARRAYIGERQKWLVRISEGGTRTGMPAVTALLAFLNAHHEDYGRPRIESIKAAIGPLFKLFGQVLKEEFGDGSDRPEKLLNKVMELYEMRVAGKFSG